MKEQLSKESYPNIDVGPGLETSCGTSMEKFLKNWAESARIGDWSERNFCRVLRLLGIDGFRVSKQQAVRSKQQPKQNELRGDDGVNN